MAEQVSLEQWRTLYQLAGRVKEMAPWQWMEEVDVFGVKNPDRGDLGFVSVMGALGEHFSIALYLGARPLYEFWRMQDDETFWPVEHIMDMTHLQAMFMDRSDLWKEDRALLKQLGLSYRGRDAWPIFRSYLPAHMLWFLEADEVRFLTCALEQVLDVAPRFKQKRDLLSPGTNQTYLVRVARKSESGLLWEDQRIKVPPPADETIKLAMDVPLLEKLKQMPRSSTHIEIDLFQFPGPIREKKSERPSYAYVPLMVDARTGIVYHVDLLAVTTSLEDMWGQVPLTVVRQLARLGLLPDTITVRWGLLVNLLAPLAAELGFKLRQSDEMPMLDDAKASLMERF